MQWRVQQATRRRGVDELVCNDACSRPSGVSVFFKIMVAGGHRTFGVILLVGNDCCSRKISQTVQEKLTCLIMIFR